MCPGTEAGISNFLRGEKTSLYDQLSFLFGFKGGGGVLEEILNDAPLTIALSLYYFMLVFGHQDFFTLISSIEIFPI